MALVTRTDRRSGDRRTDGVTAKILHTMFAMRRGFGNAAAKNLLLRSGLDDELAERVLAIPEERRTQRRRIDEAPSMSGDRHPTSTDDDGPVTLDTAAMAILHRLRFEADTGMHRMTISECPVELLRFALIRLDDDGKPVITAQGRQALKHFACVRVLNNIQSGLDALMMSEEIRTWLESNMFLQRIGNEYKLTELGNNWLEFNRSISQNRPMP
jgi:hypothetical protein